MTRSRRFITPSLSLSILLGVLACDSNTDTPSDEANEQPRSDAGDASAKEQPRSDAGGPRGGHQGTPNTQALLADSGPGNDSGVVTGGPMGDSGGTARADAGDAGERQDPPTTADAGRGDAGPAVAVNVSDCASMCETAEQKECSGGTVAGCTTTCPYLEAFCGEQMAAYFACSEDKDHQPTTASCDPDGGFVLHNECLAEAGAIVACSSNL